MIEFLRLLFVLFILGPVVAFMSEEMIETVRDLLIVDAA